MVYFQPTERKKNEIQIYKNIYIQNHTWVLMIHIMYTDLTLIRAAGGVYDFRNLEQV